MNPLILRFVYKNHTVLTQPNQSDITLAHTAGVSTTEAAFILDVRG